MAYSIAGALQPIAVTFLLGIIGAWRGDFRPEDTSVLNRLMLTYALPGVQGAGGSDLGPWIPAFEAVIKSHELPDRRPRGSGDPYVDGPRLARVVQRRCRFLVDCGHMSGPPLSRGQAFARGMDGRWPRWVTRIGSRTGR
jgi:hypothetical protein